MFVFGNGSKRIRLESMLRTITVSTITHTGSIFGFLFYLLPGMQQVEVC